MGRFSTLGENKPTRTPLARRGVRKFVVVTLTLCFLLATWFHFGNTPNGTIRKAGLKLSSMLTPWAVTQPVYRMPPKPIDNHRYSATVVAGVLSAEQREADWIDEVENLERKAIYVVDDKTAPLHLERNHGRESMVYLQYILEHYGNLTDVTFFMHAHGKAWHNNILLRHHSASTLNLLRRSWVQHEGYANTRCDLHPGCPRWIQFDATRGETDAHPVRISDTFNSERWSQLFPEVKEVPNSLAAPCCAQFAVTREKIQAVPIETYQRLHAYIRDEPLDGFTGRLMEYTWHYLFTGKDELCPAMMTCYCEMYGMCDLEADLVDKWQANQVRANELDDRAMQMRNSFAHGNDSVEDDSEYRSLRENVEKLWSRANRYGEQMYTRFGIPPIIED